MVRHDEHLEAVNLHLKRCGEYVTLAWLHCWWRSVQSAREHLHYFLKVDAAAFNFFFDFQFCCLATTLAQYNGPPRLNIPGAIPLPALSSNQQGGRALGGQTVRVRRPNRPQPVVTEARFIDEAKPVSEEPEDEYAPQQQQHQPAPPSPPRALFTSEPLEFHQPEVQSNAQRFNVERPRPAQRNLPQPQPQRPRAQNFDEQRPHQKPHNSEDKPKKPVAQILRKYREENPNGSITWGFENDDGSFKEETIGIDCITRGIYGYIDPDGEKRVRRGNWMF